VGRLGGRLALVGLLAVVFGRISSVSAEPGLLIGITDSRFLSEPASSLADARDLGLGAVHFFLGWRPDETALSATDIAALNATVAHAGGVRLVVTVDGKATEPPTSEEARTAYCAYVGDLIARYPTINDIVIWNEPNVDYFWQPQYGPDGSSAAPDAYEALLAQCYDVLHVLRPGVNVIMSTSPGGNNNPAAASNVSYAAGTFIEDMGAAYRASGRARPIFDTVAHSAYGLDSAEPPWHQHLSPNLIGEGDLDRLVQALDNAFGGTAQPVPGDCGASPTCPAVWYLEAGWQTIPDATHAQFYTGTENDDHPVPDQPVPGDAAAPTQSRQLIAGIQLAYCQPYVGAIFNFLLQDQTGLEGWQSGVRWANGDPKASFGALRQAISDIGSAPPNCQQLEASEGTAIAPAARPGLVDRVEWPVLTTYSVFNTVWSFAIDTRADATYQAAIAPTTKPASGPSAPLTATGTLAAGHPRMLQLPSEPLPAGNYRIRVAVTSAHAPKETETLTSPTFTVR
jgi:hypothetical protein